MALTPLTTAQKTQLELHINDLLVITGEDFAAQVANEAVGLYEVFAANLPGGLTGFDCGIQEGPTLSVPESNILEARINAMTAVLGDEIAADIANECLELYEERAMGLIGQTTGRDVTQNQLP